MEATIERVWAVGLLEFRVGCHGMGVHAGLGNFVPYDTTKEREWNVADSWLRRRRVLRSCLVPPRRFRGKKLGGLLMFKKVLSSLTACVSWLGGSCLGNLSNKVVGCAKGKPISLGTVSAIAESFLSVAIIDGHSVMGLSEP